MVCKQFIFWQWFTLILQLSFQELFFLGTNWNGTHELKYKPYERDSKRGEDRTIKRWERRGKHTYRRRQRGSLQRDIRRREKGRLWLGLGNSLFNGDYWGCLHLRCEETHKKTNIICTQTGHNNGSHLHVMLDSGKFVRRSIHTIPDSTHTEKSLKNWSQV